MNSLFSKKYTSAALARALFCVLRIFACEREKQIKGVERWIGRPKLDIATLSHCYSAFVLHTLVLLIKDTF